jgi:DNA-binding SARP family transcriptional activator/class 3 adenylate cyclase
MRLRLLGAFHLETEDGSVISLPTKKTKALLAYLACFPGQPLTRSKLSSLFWEESAPPQARDALRQTLSALRKALSPHHIQTLRTHGDTVIFDPHLIHVDALVFRRLLESDDPADLAGATQLYRGPFLDGFDLHAPEFDVWLRSVRQHHHEQVIETLKKLLRHYMIAENVDRALTFGSRLLSLDPMREGVHRSMMELHLRQGRYIDALRQYEQCVAILHRELNIEPDARTKKLHQQIIERRRQRQEDGREDAKDHKHSDHKYGDHKPGEKRDAPSTERLPSERVHWQAADAAALSAALPFSLPFAASARRLERRQMTVLTCALGALNTLADSLDLEDLRPAVNAWRRRCAEAVARFDGVPAHFSGEIMTFYFGYPQAHEHCAEQAVRAGMTLIKMTLIEMALTEMAVAGDAASPALAKTPGLRVAVATSPVVVGDFSGEGEPPVHDVIGEAPGMALRLLCATPPGALLISGQTRGVVGDLFHYAPVSLDACPLPARAADDPGSDAASGWRVTGENIAKNRFEAVRGAPMTAFLGREAEIERLLHCWRQARSGEGQMQLIVGEPGVGKSRLARAFQDLILGERFIKLMYQCTPFHANSALYPIIQHMEHTAGFTPKDSPGQKLDKLEALLARSSARPLETARLCANLLSIPAGDRYPPLVLPPPQLRRRVLVELLNQIETLAKHRPLLILLEDAHWLDASSEEVLDMLSERIRRLPIFAMVTTRPGFEPPWSGLDHVGRMPLGGLDQNEVRTMVSQLCGDVSLPGKVIDQIVAKTDGVPLFVEELAKSVLESSHGPSATTAAAPRAFGPAPLSVPATLRDSLLARLDRLGPAKEIAQIGATIGRRFSHGLLQAVAMRSPRELAESLDRLIESGLVYRIGSTRASSPATDADAETSYAFKHALVQEAAYETLAKSERQALHAAIARAIEESFPAEAHGRPEIKAHHYTQADMPREALAFWRKAGELAKARSAHREAAAHLEEGLRLIGAAPSLSEQERRRGERTFLMAIGPSVMALKGFAVAESEAIFERAHQLIDDDAPAAERIGVLRGLWSVQFARSNMARALELSAEALTLAKNTGEGMCQARCMMGQTLTSMGDFRLARPHLQMVVDYYRNGKTGGSSDPIFTVSDYPWALVYLARVLWGLGLTTQSAATIEEAVAHARAGQDSVATAVAFVGRMFLAVHGAELQEAMTSAEEALVHCTEQELALFGQWTRFGQGALLAKQGKITAGIDIMRSAVEALDAVQSGQFRPFMLGGIAEAYLYLGDLQHALTTVGEALAQAERSGEKQSAAALHRLHGEILAAMSRPEEAARAFQATLELARKQGALLEELRVAIVLAKRPAGAAEAEAARRMLRAVHDAFEEGSEHPYLKAARDVLAVLEAGA